jgi:hypothetical protein
MFFHMGKRCASPQDKLRPRSGGISGSQSDPRVSFCRGGPSFVRGLEKPADPPREPSGEGTLDAKRHGPTPCHRSSFSRWKEEGSRHASNSSNSLSDRARPLHRVVPAAERPRAHRVALSRREAPAERITPTCSTPADTATRSPRLELKSDPVVAPGRPGLSNRSSSGACRRRRGCTAGRTAAHPSAGEESAGCEE